MGGPSSEHDVSLKTGENIYRNLDRSKYIPSRLVLSKSWKLTHEGKEIAFPAGFKKFDVIFIALHGVFGEDGSLQTILDTLNVAYTGSGATASAIGMDKWVSGELFKKAGFLIPHTRLFQGEVPVPSVVKARRGGSSIGTFLIRKKEDIPHLDGDYLVQEILTGPEYTCGVLEVNERPGALPVIEIRASGNFFDYRSKYSKGGAEEIVPAPITAALSKKIRSLAVKAHKTIGARGYSRSDFILSNGKLYILEINTLPGLTEASLLPKAAVASGITFPKLLDLIIEAR